jgi:tRNA wybutosine-synthesizing protein 3
MKTDVLPSFSRLRQQNLEALYGATNGHVRIDRSRAGGVDKHIQGLVHCINRNESFVTLSSCSGRIALFDPMAAASNHSADDDQPVTTRDGTGNDTAVVVNPMNEIEAAAAAATLSGKGSTGNWLLVSHDEIDPASILPFFRDQSEPNLYPTTATDAPPCSLKFEPMLLHVAACNLERGKQLLQIALQAGFRESGLVVTDERVTVAIRTQSLGLAVPLSRQSNHPLRPSALYLQAIVVEANRRLVTNLERLQKLHAAIERTLLHDCVGSDPLACTVQLAKYTIPDLYLYGHAMVCAQGVGSNADLLVFGGYGPGPFRKSPQRSAEVFALPSAGREESSQWESIELQQPHPDDAVLSLGQVRSIKVEPMQWEACQGTAVISLSSTSDADCHHHFTNVFVLFGGRKGPAHPLGTLSLFTYTRTSANRSSGRFYASSDVRGDAPSPRWGHALTPIENAWTLHESSPIALLTGGRNDTETAIDSVYVLSVVPVGELGDAAVVYHFLWESVNDDSVSRELCRFHHTAVALDRDCFFVFGGLASADPIAAIEGSCDAASPGVILSMKSRTSEESNSAVFQMDLVEMPSGVSSRFSHGACAVRDFLNGDVSVLLNGGVCLDASMDESASNNPVLQCVEVVSQRHSRDAPWKLENRAIEWKSSVPADFGSLVHHSCVRLPSSDNAFVALVGGGVSGFAFQDCYATSLCLSFENGNGSKSNTLQASHLQDMLRSAPVRSSPSNETGVVTECDVVYVDKRNAKSLKTQLEETQLLDKRYRLTDPVQSGVVSWFRDMRELASYMAVPVCPSCVETMVAQLPSNNDESAQSAPTWMRLVAGYGKQSCPRSSGSFARSKQIPV